MEKSQNRVGRLGCGQRGPKRRYQRRQGKLEESELKRGGVAGWGIRGVVAKGPDPLTDFGFMADPVRMNEIEGESLKTIQDERGVSKSMGVTGGSGAGEVEGSGEGGVLQSLQTGLRGRGDGTGSRATILEERTDELLVNLNVGVGVGPPTPRHHPSEKGDAVGGLGPDVVKMGDPV